MASTDLVFQDEVSARNAINDLRKQNNTNYVLFGYLNADAATNTVVLLSQGAGGLEELKSHLKPDNIAYGLVSVQDQIDESLTLKFVFIIWCGANVPFMKKAKMTTHKGSISTLVGQYHNDFYASSLDDLTQEAVVKKVKDASGTSVHVKEGGSSGSGSPAPVASSTRSVASSAPRSSGGATSSSRPGVAQGATGQLKFVDEDALRAGISAVRSDSDETDWVLFGYEGNTNNIRLLGRGSSGLDELLPLLKDNEIAYGLYRTTDTVDNTVAVKFVLILWVGEKVPVIRKARITTHKGEVTSFVGQYHVDINCSNLHEINEDIIRDTVQAASGTKINVK